MNSQRESEPGRGISWPAEPRPVVDYGGTINGWWPALPPELRHAFYNDPYVHAIVCRAAQEGLTQEQMLCRLLVELYKSQKHWLDEVVKIIERTAPTTVKPS